jgi:plasmid maintenance system killer protein
MLITLDVIIEKRYYLSMIQSFADKNTEKLARMERIAKFVQIERIALRKLLTLGDETSKKR